MVKQIDSTMNCWTDSSFCEKPLVYRWHTVLWCENWRPEILAYASRQNASSGLCGLQSESVILGKLTELIMLIAYLSTFTAAVLQLHTYTWYLNVKHKGCAYFYQIIAAVFVSCYYFRHRDGLKELKQYRYHWWWELAVGTVFESIDST